MFRTRIAPTPSGFLHIGNIFSFVLTALIANQHRGIIKLRIDDLDAERMRIAYIDDIFSCLDWLKIHYHEGPSGTADFLQNFSQHLRLPSYSHNINRLAELGHVYGCNCSRAYWQSMASENKHIYPQICRTKTEGLLNAKDTAWRVALPTLCKVQINEWQKPATTIDLNQTVGDFVIRRRDNQMPAYQIASLTDDETDGINFIVRGADLLHSTAAQLHLANVLQFSNFQKVTFLHHGLVQDEGLKKMSKSQESLSVQEMRNGGITAKAIYQHIAKALSVPLAERICTFSELQSAWTEAKIPYNDWKMA